MLSFIFRSALSPSTVGGAGDTAENKTDIVSDFMNPLGQGQAGGREREVDLDGQSHRYVGSDNTMGGRGGGKESSLPLTTTLFRQRLFSLDPHTWSERWVHEYSLC